MSERTERAPSLFKFLCFEKILVATRDGNSAAYAAVHCSWCTTPHSVATKICIMSKHQRSAAYYNFLLFFTIIAGKLFLYVQQWLVKI